MYLRLRGAACAVAGMPANPRSVRIPTFRLAILVFAASLMAAAPSRAHEFKLGDIEIIHPWSRATPEGAKVAAGYLAIKNNGAEPDRLVSASGEIAGRTEIHEMAVSADGVMTMRPMPDGLEVPAGASVELKPGSFHIMFMELKQGAKEGQPFKGELVFEHAGAVAVEFSVEAVGGDAEHGDHGG